VLRPRPGAGKRGVETPSSASAQRPAAAPAAAGPLLASAAAGLESTSSSREPAVDFRRRLRGSLQVADIGALRRQALTRFAASKNALRPRALPTKWCWRRAMHCVRRSTKPCSPRPGASKANGAQQTLLRDLHREAWGGEKFFEMLERTLERCHALDRLDGVAISVHRHGVCRQVSSSGSRQTRLAEIQHELYRRIRDHRGAVPPVLSLRWSRCAINAIRIAIGAVVGWSRRRDW